MWHTCEEEHVGRHSRGVAFEDVDFASPSPVLAIPAPICELRDVRCCLWPGQDTRQHHQGLGPVQIVAHEEVALEKRLLQLVHLRHVRAAHVSSSDCRDGVRAARGCRGAEEEEDVSRPARPVQGQRKVEMLSGCSRDGSPFRGFVGGLVRGHEKLVAPARQGGAPGL